jgi:hypothetical protein
VWLGSCCWVAPYVVAGDEHGTVGFRGDNLWSIMP